MILMARSITRLTPYQKIPDSNPDKILYLIIFGDCIINIAGQYPDNLL